MTSFKPSILSRMVLGQLLTVILFCVVTAANVVWQFKKSDVGGEVNKDLRINAQAIANTLNTASLSLEQLQFKAETAYNVIRENVEQYKKEFSTQDFNGIFALHVQTMDGRFVFRSSNYPDERMSTSQTGFAVAKQSGHLWQQFTLRDEQRGLIVQVAQNTQATNENLYDILVRFILMPLIWFLPLAGLVTYFCTARGLQPLRSLAQMISLRNPSDLTAITPPKRYAETQPIVSALNSLLLKLEITLERERHFLADAAHELRTPLAVIQAQAFVLEQAQNKATKTAAINELNSGIERAASLIQKLLLNAKLSTESFSPKLQDFDFCEFVQERIAYMSVLASSKNIEMELTAPHICKVRLDQGTFISAIDNVLDNAIRYTPAGGNIHVTVEQLPETNEIVLRVADNGMGIPESFRARVFERFFRIPGTEQNGSGLGLSIVKRILKLHGGDAYLSAGLNNSGVAVNLRLPSGA